MDDLITKKVKEAHNKFLRTVDYYLTKDLILEKRHKFCQLDPFETYLAGTWLEAPHNGGNDLYREGTTMAPGCRSPLALRLAAVCAVATLGSWISTSFVVGQPPAPNCRSVARRAEEGEVALEAPPSDAEISQETSLDPRPVRKFRPKREANERINDEYEA
eukprot:s877_g11.t1